ncbi:MAG: hypothetical protein ACLFRP_01950 [Puniceicoccaceae bacterium]
MAPKKAFPKPTGIAAAAAALGILVHLAVFFFLRIGIATPSAIVERPPVLAYLGEADPGTTALIDPLGLLVSTQRAAPPLDARDFRDLSISREIGSFPPVLTTAQSGEWAAWIPSGTRDDNPGAWLLEQSESSLRDFGRAPLPPFRLPADRITLVATPLDGGGATLVESLPLSADLRREAAGSALLSPASFLLDRTSPWSRPPPLPLSSSGKDAIDAILGRDLDAGETAARLKSGYFLVTFYFPPVPEEPPPESPSE